MYRYSNGQIRLTDFKQPMGMNLKEENRWVKRAKLMPWDMVEDIYAEKFKNERADDPRPISARIAFDSLHIQSSNHRNARRMRELWNTSAKIRICNTFWGCTSFGPSRCLTHL